MKASTVAALNRINRRFYDRYSDPFSATRSRPWSGWNRAIAPFLAQNPLGSPTGAAPAILDVGCGNGRFAVFLNSTSEGPYWYLGLDDSVEMLELARQRLRSMGSLEVHFERHDVSGTEGDLDLGGRQFDLVVVVGVMHHIPGFRHRRDLLESLAGSLAQGGTMILSFWQFGKEERFRRRVLNWSDFNAASSEMVDEGNLERGDYLLAWGNNEGVESKGEDSLGPCRYCHYADADEIARLTGALELRTVDRFAADGRTGDLNLYMVLRADSGA